MHKVYTGSGSYDFEVLISSYPSLEPFVFYGKSNRQTIDFNDAKAVRALNTALLKHNYGVKYWEFSEKNLCPPISGRVQYIHLLADLLKSSGINGDIKILDIGTGASCIYPILGNKEYGWRFVATEIVESSLDSAEQILKKNNLSSVIELKFQSNPEYIFKDIIKPEDKFSASICNPPFYKSEAEAK
ncbi:MAG: RlmF-related methyltransferase, partial [Bacteroidota bacterium]